MPDPKQVAPISFAEAPPTREEEPNKPKATFNTAVHLTMGQLSFLDRRKSKDGEVRSCVFQFNPTELERSRTVKFTRTPTGNTLDTRRAGERNQTKRKFSRKPDPWSMTLNLRFDAGYYANAAAAPGSYSDKIDAIDNAIRFFEALVEPDEFATENEKPSNANETPPPPTLLFFYGQRSWKCAVQNLRIKELEYTPDLAPRRFEVTIGLEAIETTDQNERGKTGAQR